MLWGISRLGWVPSDVWVQALHEHAFNLLPYFEPHQFASMMCSMASMRAWPSEVSPACFSVLGNGMDEDVIGRHHKNTAPAVKVLQTTTLHLSFHVYMS